MKKALFFIVTMLAATVITFAQKNYSITIEKNNGKLLKEENGTYRMNLTFNGITSEKETETLKNYFTSNENVKVFELSGTAQSGKAVLLLNNNDKNKIAEMFKNANVTTVIVDEKEYAITDIETLEKDLKAKQSNSRNKTN